jgi:hypothetical protein
MYPICIPLLLLDVDGVISLFGFDRQRPPAGRYVLVDGHLHFLSGAAGGLIAELEPFYELVWCTGWEERADAHLPEALGLPSGLEHVRLQREQPAGTAAEPDCGAALRHWKLDAIDAFAGPERALAWLDDAHDDSCAAWAADRRGPTLLLATDAAEGITGAHVRRLLDWAGALPRGGCAAADQNEP